MYAKSNIGPNTIRLLTWITLLSACAYPALAKAEWVALPSSVFLWAHMYEHDLIRVSNLPTPIANPAGCADPDSYIVRATLTKEAKSRIYASLLMAKAMGKPVTVWINGCEATRPAIETVVIEQ